MTKSIFITGAASGIGAEAVRLLAAKGATIAAADLNAEGARKIAADVEAGSRPAEGNQATSDSSGSSPPSPVGR